MDSGISGANCITFEMSIWHPIARDGTKRNVKFFFHLTVSSVVKVEKFSNSPVIKFTLALLFPGLF